MVYYECYYISQSNFQHCHKLSHWNMKYEIWNNGFNYFVHISMTTPKPNIYLGFNVKTWWYIENINMVQYCRFISINLYTFNLSTAITMMEVRDGFPIPSQWWRWEMGSQVISRNEFGNKKTIMVGGECTNVLLTCTCE
jgi:hypothetical protein